MTVSEEKEESPLAQSFLETPEPDWETQVIVRPSDECDAHPLSEHMEGEASYKAGESPLNNQNHGAKSQANRT